MMTDEAARVARMFDAPAARYDRLIGRYLGTLAPALCDVADVEAGMRVLDVGCGPGGLTRELVARCGADSVSAIDPSPPFVVACRTRNPGVDVAEGFAESLPYGDDSFDAALSSLAVGFMRDAQTGIREMVRATVPGGTVAACAWDRERMTTLSLFGRAALALDPSLDDDVKLVGDSPGELQALFNAAGLSEVVGGTLMARGDYDNFEDWWEPFTLGVGPHGAYCQSLDDEHREALRLACREQFDTPGEPFTLEARAWFARGTVAD